jgi:hypothetical protein
MDNQRGGSAVILAGAFLMLGGVLNLIYGIAAISNSNFFVHNTRYVFSDLKTWGWIALIIGVLELFAAFSLTSGKAFGRWFGIVVRLAERDQRSAVDPRLSVLVAGDLRAEPVDRLRAGGLLGARRPVTAYSNHQDRRDR